MKRFKSKFLNNKYIKNFSSQFVSNVISQVLAFIIITYSARILGATKFGEYSLAFSFMTYALLFSNFGLSTYSSREIPRIENIKPLVDFTVSIRFILSILFSLILIFVSNFFHISKAFVWIIVACGVQIVVSSFDMQWVFISKEKMWKISFLKICGQIVYLALIFVFVKSSADIVIFSFLTVTVVFIPATISFIMYSKNFGRYDVRLKLAEWKVMWREIFIMGLNSLVITINSYLMFLIIGFYFNTTELGYYSAGFKLIMIFIVLYNLINSVVYPSISRLYIENKIKLLKFLNIYFLASLIIGLISGVFLTLSSGWIIDNFFGKEYAITEKLVLIWSTGLLPLTPLAIFFVNSLIPCNLSKESLITTFTASIISIVSIPICFKVFGFLGAAVPSIISESINILLGGYFLFKRLHVKKEDLITILKFKENIKLVKEYL